MPRKKTPKPAQQNQKRKAAWGGYVNCPMGQSERAGFDDWLSKSVDILALLEQVITDGYTYSSLKDEANHAIIARLYFVVNTPDGDKGMMLTAFHEDWQLATALLMYKHFIVLDGDWFGETEDAQTQLTWG